MRFRLSWGSSRRLLLSWNDRHGDVVGVRGRGFKTERTYEQARENEAFDGIQVIMAEFVKQE